jgi:hypothetical protein
MVINSERPNLQLDDKKHGLLLYVFYLLIIRIACSI